MSYTLTPILVDLDRVKALMGSKDTKLLQAVIKKHQEDMRGIDSMGSYYEEFEKEIKKGYRALAAGDFSAVDLKKVYPKVQEEDDADDEGDPELAEFAQKLKAVDQSDRKGREKADGMLKDMLTRLFQEAIENDDEDEEEEDEEPFRELTTGEALVHMILGGKPDPSQGYKYGYALSILCEHLGKTLDNEFWSSNRFRSLEAIDDVLKRAGVPVKTFRVVKCLIERGAPVKIPEPDDFPSIGYLTRQEIPRILTALDAPKIETAIEREDEYEREWFHGAIDELRSWLRAASKAKRDLICFYY
jgi:hypothetical protein